MKCTKIKMVLGVYPMTTPEQLEEVFMAESALVLAFLDSLKVLTI